MTTDPQKAGENVTQSVFGPRQQRKPSISSRQASPMHEPGGVAGVEDYQVALATYRAACERWPGTPITLRQGARVIEDSRRLRMAS